MDGKEFDVLVAGAGPVGLTLAIDLAARGARVMVVERERTPRVLPKMERCNPRTMEIYRRMGLADRIRAASAFRDIPMDVFVCTSLVDPPLLHLPYPSVTEAKARIARCNDGSMPLEPSQVISQYTLEPLLQAAAAAMPGVTLRRGAELQAFTQDASGVTATVALAEGGTQALRARYLAGCDGGVSAVRRQCGIRLEGEGRIRRVHQVFFRSERLFESIPIGKGRHYYMPEGAVVVQDDLRHFMINFMELGEDEDPAQKLRALIRLDVDIEILHRGSWNYHLLVAERYRQGRVFLAGDSAHLVIPQGGLGMNTGVGDAADLSWKLAGTLQGWGGPGLLQSYEIERRDVALRNREGSREAAKGVRIWRDACKPDLRDDTAGGRARRAEVARLAAIGQPIGHELLGIEMGYRYRSPIVCAEPGEEAPAAAVGEPYRPSTVPGVRLPHLWLEDGRAVQDRLGAGYTLLRLGASPPDTAGLEAAMRATGAPFEALALPDPRLREVYGRNLLLLRPDLHVAWRGDRAPADPAAVAAACTGRTGHMR